MSTLIPNSQQQEQLIHNQTVQRLCAIHEGELCTLLCTDPSRTDCSFKCDYCVVDQALQGKYLIPITQIQKSNNKTVFWHWPLPEDSEILRKIKDLSIRPKTDIQVKDNLDKYFKELRIEILAKIDSVQEQMHKQAEQLWDFDSRIIEQYNVFCAKETLKKIVFDSETEQQQLSTRIREIIAGVVSIKEAAKDALEDSLSQLALQESAVDFEGPLKLKQEVLEKLSRISMFLVEDMRDLAAEKNDHNDYQASENLDAIVSLSTSKLNNTTERFQQQLRRQLQKFRKVLQKIDLGDVKEERKRVDEFAVLDEGDIEEVQRFVSALIKGKTNQQDQGKGVDGRDRSRRLQVSDITQLVKCKANHLSDEAAQQIQVMLENVKRYIGTFQVQSVCLDGYAQEKFENLDDNQIKNAQEVAQELKELLQDGENNESCLREIIGIGQQMINAQKQIVQPDQNHMSVEKVLEMVNNETNFCSQNYSEKIRKALEGVKLYIESFEVDAEAEVEEERGLEKEQLSWLGKLGSKMRELKQKCGEEYAKRVKPTKEWQDKSARICHILKRELDLNQNGGEEIELLLCQLPVFEMLRSELREVKSIKLPWALSTYDSSSSSLQLMDEQNGIRIVQKTSVSGQAVTNDMLDNNLVYSFTCSFNIPIPGDKWIYLGLFQDDKINSSWRGGFRGNEFFNSYSSYTDNEIIKGQLLNTAPVNSLLTVIHFRICISTQSFFIADQTHTNINKVKPKYFNKDGKYRFGIQFSTSTGGDYSCCVSDVRVYSDQSLVDQF